MSWISRIRNSFRREHILRELDEEFSTHVEEAVRQGRSPEEARRALGQVLRHRESSLDIRLFPRLESIVADAIFGWRQLAKHRAANAGAILSLALAVGAVTGVFRLVEAVLLRPLPVASPELLRYIEITSVDRDGRPSIREDFSYPQFREYRKALEDQADLLLIGYAYQQDVTFGPGAGVEKFYPQYVSGNVFGVFGLQPAAGRLLTPDDDLEPAAHPVAVLSHDYWTRRFGRDPGVVGKTFRYGGALYEIVGVGPKDFVGTEPGAIADAFIPAMRNAEALESAGWSWFRIWLRPKPGTPFESVRHTLQAVLTHQREEQVKQFTAGTSKERIEAHLAARIVLSPAAAGASVIQRQYRQPLLILFVLAALVLLIACANVANLRTALAIAREREIALRVSIGAGRGRLYQMTFIESALAAFLASLGGVVFAWYSAPFIVSMLTPPEDPVRLVLGPDLPTLGFVAGLTGLVTLLCGLTPALRASSVRPAGALKGGETPRSQRRLLNSILAAQVSFCMLVLFVAGLFTATFSRLTNQYMGFSPENVLVVVTESTTGKRPPGSWTQVADRLRQTPGVQAVALSGWPLMSGNRWTVGVQSGGEPSQVSPLALDVSPGFFETMKIGLLGGRDFRAGDRPPELDESGQPIGGVAIVNDAFAQYFFGGRNPVGESVRVYVGKDVVAPLEIVGYVRDARYRNLRDPILPTLYVPIEARPSGSFMVRTATEPLSAAEALRREISHLDSGLQVRNITTQEALIRRHSIRERLLATLSMFFAATALVLAGMGLYSVLSYSVIHRRREFGIRMALGARSIHIARRVVKVCTAPLCVGVTIGVGLGLACEQYIRSLLYEVDATDASLLVVPAASLLVIAIIAALHPAVQAVRIDPAQTLKSE